MKHSWAKLFPYGEGLLLLYLIRYIYSMEIHKAIKGNQFAVMYYRLKTGEALPPEVARARFRSTKNPDLSICTQVNNLIHSEQTKLIESEK